MGTPRVSAEGQSESGNDNMTGEAANATRARGHVKWFDRKRGFGFIVPDDGGPDILLHCTIISPHGRRELPDLCAVECDYVDSPKGRQAVLLHSFELPELPAAEAGRSAKTDIYLVDEAGPYVPVTCKWFSRVRGYGFFREEGREDDIFFHMETLRDAGLHAASPGDILMARIMDGERGPHAVQIRLKTEAD